MATVNVRHRRNYEDMKVKVLRTAAKMFLEDGYQNTTIRGIAECAGVEKHTILYVFGEKEAILCELVQYVLEAQYAKVTQFLQGKTNDKILFYATETVLQLYLAESSEHIREMYTAAYSMPNSAKIIYSTITEKLEQIFEEHLPGLESRDFYEFEVAAAGIMRNFMTVPCDFFFPMDRKVRKFLQTTFRMYRIPEEKINEAIRFVTRIDFRKLAEEVLVDMLPYLESRIG